MANPVCSGCGHEFFAATKVEVVGLEEMVTLIYCSRCGVAVGVLDHATPKDYFHQLSEKLEDIDFKISNFIK